MDVNFEKVDTHQSNQMIFLDWTLPGRTNGEIVVEMMINIDKTSNLGYNMVQLCFQPQFFHG